MKNAKLSSKIYPGWICYIYHSSDVDKVILKEISKIKHTKLIYMDKSNISPRLWRYIPVFETNATVIVRDTDSRLNKRESAAVGEWLKSDKDIHIMRDHKAHKNKIMAGMFGAREVS